MIVGPHRQVWAYDGMFGCIDCKEVWGACTGKPKNHSGICVAPDTIESLQSELAGLRDLKDINDQLESKLAKCKKELQASAFQSTKFLGARQRAEELESERNEARDIIDRINERFPLALQAVLDELKEK